MGKTIKDGMDMLLSQNEMLRTMVNKLCKERNALKAELSGHKATLAAFEREIPVSQEVYDHLALPGELEKWIHRAAWHCKKVDELHFERDSLKARCNALERAIFSIEEHCSLCTKSACRMPCGCINGNAWEFDQAQFTKEATP